MSVKFLGYRRVKAARGLSLSVLLAFLFIAVFFIFFAPSLRAEESAIQGFSEDMLDRMLDEDSEFSDSDFWQMMLDEDGGWQQPLVVDAVVEEGSDEANVAEHHVVADHRKGTSNENGESDDKGESHDAAR